MLYKYTAFEKASRSVVGQPHGSAHALLSPDQSRLQALRLVSFATITTDLPPEISEAGHDRRPAPIKPEDLDAG